MSTITNLKRFDKEYDSACFIKSRTNMGELSKQYVYEMCGMQLDPAICITKYVLTDSPRIYVTNGFQVCKVFKNYFLVRAYFSIKINTLQLIQNKFFNLED